MNIKKIKFFLVIINEKFNLEHRTVRLMSMLTVLLFFQVQPELFFSVQCELFCLLNESKLYCM